MNTRSVGRPSIATTPTAGASATSANPSVETTAVETTERAWQPGARAVVDSAMTVEQAVTHPTAPAEILKNQRVISVRYVGFDGAQHTGQVVVDRRLEADVRALFELARQLNYPIQSVVPISQFDWSDDASMRVNNTSGFNFRDTTGGGSLSKHAFGYAIDLNPRINPYIKGTHIEPANGVYAPGTAGTLTADHPLVAAFKARGWSWGGDWTSHKDYQHFEKPLPPDYEAINRARRTAITP